MRIEERCNCGAELVLVVDPTKDRYAEKGATENRAWAQVDRWRRLHKPCRTPPEKKGKGLNDG